MAKPEKKKVRPVVKFDPKVMPSRTIASHAKGLDVNDIVKTYGAPTGQPGQYPMGAKVPKYLDMTKTMSVFDALNLKVQIDKFFLGLPSATRERFDNDSLKFAQFASDGKNMGELVKMGLVKPPEKKPEPVAGGKPNTQQPAPQGAPQGAPPKEGAPGQTTEGEVKK